MKNQIYFTFLFLFSLGMVSAQHSISGHINCLGGLPMAGQQVQLIGDLIPNIAVSSDANGKFEFTNLPSGGDYTLTIEKTDNPANGVTTFDLVKIIQHILGIDFLPDPYAALIADANGSGAITTLDLVIIRKVILAIESNFPINLSWHFATEDFSISPPEGSVDQATISNLQDDEVINFIAIKIGNANTINNCE